MKKLLLTLALLFPSEAWAQCNGVFGANQVCGSTTGGPPGPVDASIFSAGISIATPVIPGYIATGATSSSAIWLPNVTDTSSVEGNGASFYIPMYFANPGTGIVDRFNRVFIGTATHSSSDASLISGGVRPTVQDWPDAPGSFGAGAVASQLAVGSAVGWSAITGYSKSSDWRTAFNSAASATVGLAGYVVNDDTMGGPLALGLYIAAAVGPTNGGITLGTQMDISSQTAPVDVSPFIGPHAGVTMGVLLTPGAFAGLATQNVSAAMQIAPGGLSSVFRKGIICSHGALDPTASAAGDGDCLELGRNQSIIWVNSGDGIDGEISADATGIKFSVDQAWGTFTLSPSCGSASFTTTSARSKTLGKTTFAEFDLTITAIGTCTNLLDVSLPNQMASAGALVGQEVVNTAKGVNCFNIATAVTMHCRKADASNFAVNDRIVLSGVYEND